MNKTMEAKLEAAKKWLKEQGITEPRVKVSYAVWSITRIPSRMPDGLVQTVCTYRPTSRFDRLTSTY